ncbi:MAG: GPW/gp25 family protein [Anaerolineae bacterium]|nr:GPW/gp25 family protein [Anaerolineae bacterium]
MSTDFLGKGLAFPLQINARGGLKESKLQQKVKESIGMILGTEPGERLMRPNFGCYLQTLIFAPNNTTTANLAAHYVEEALTTWEHRIILADVTVHNDHSGGRLVVDLQYRLKATNEPQNLVYPFYLEQA